MTGIIEAAKIFLEEMNDDEKFSNKL